VENTAQLETESPKVKEKRMGDFALGSVFLANEIEEATNAHKKRELVQSKKGEQQSWLIVTGSGAEGWRKKTPCKRLKSAEERGEIAVCNKGSAPEPAATER